MFTRKKLTTRVGVLTHLSPLSPAGSEIANSTHTYWLHTSSWTKFPPTWSLRKTADRTKGWLVGQLARLPVVSVALKESGITARMKEMKPLFYTPAHSWTSPEALCIRRWRGRCSIKALLHIYKWIFGDSRILKCKVAYKLNTDSPTVHVCIVMGIIIFLC